MLGEASTFNKSKKARRQRKKKRKAKVQAPANKLVVKGPAVGKGRTKEVKCIAALEAAKEVFLMKNYVQELSVVFSIAEQIVIFCDNNGAMAQAKEPRSHYKSKHILRRYHLLQEMVGKGNVRVECVTSIENTVDPLTKPVSHIAHTQHLDKMGLRKMGDWL
ncbi:hypothetical protein Sango_1059300 [Sesamum angolense]|uniref:Uncharacterized protein n=1 Tax=Sesamum angolense TaxID=2727404 RepID=A0AAE1X143_9LAMI|nr:hypothetical protein Sango_1059300 [Sesamum angolense]